MIWAYLGVVLQVQTPRNDVLLS